MPIVNDDICKTSPVEAEKRLAAAVLSGDEDAVRREFDAVGDSVEFTGRCFAAAITQGLVRTALLLARAGFHLNVMDEPAVAAELATGEGGMRGLSGFMGRYSYCRARRTYYLPVVQGPESAGPVSALLSEGVGLTERDKTEMLSLSVRQGNVALARVLVEGGARLRDDIHDAAPSDLRGKASVSTAGDPWAEQLSPRSSMQMIAFVLEQMDGRACPVRADWFKLYFRDPQFSEKLALIAVRSCRELCEDARSLLVELSRGGQVRAVESVLAWGGFDADVLDPAIEAARSAGHVEIAAALLRAKQASPRSLEFLDF